MSTASPFASPLASYFAAPLGKQALPFLARPASLAAVLGATPSLVSSGVVASSGGVDVMVTLDVAGVAPFLFEAYDPYAVMQDEQSIWDLAVASPHEASTMICAATFRTPDQQVHCDATTDARRQVGNRFPKSPLIRDTLTQHEL